MLPQCVDPVCSCSIEPAWDFCPSCGTDNRPPRERGPIRHHRHEWLGRQGRCVRCGEPADEPYSFNRKWRVRIAGTSLASSALCLLVLGFIRLGVALPATRIGEVVNAWYGQTVLHRSGRSYSSATMTTLLGDDISIVLVVGALFLLIVGAWMVLKIPAPETDSDD